MACEFGFRAATPRPGWGAMRRRRRGATPPPRRRSGPICQIRAAGTPPTIHHAESRVLQLGQLGAAGDAQGGGGAPGLQGLHGIMHAGGMHGMHAGGSGGSGGHASNGSATGACPPGPRHTRQQTAAPCLTPAMRCKRPSWAATVVQVRIVQKLTLRSLDERLAAMDEAGYNTFLLQASCITRCLACLRSVQYCAAPAMLGARPAACAARRRPALTSPAPAAAPSLNCRMRMCSWVSIC